jgi:hypothetical protein
MSSDLHHGGKCTTRTSSEKPSKMESVGRCCERCGPQRPFAPIVRVVEYLPHLCLPAYAAGVSLA